ncbi:hypothetical protein M0R45_002411 [Rubus argutus]|uniref:Uncharacterized protein n=1 Tax=Rubus argutus TaxID=59490 RepID=A0AAW1VSA5_RUBAR
MVKRPGYHGRGGGCVVDWDFHGGEKLGYGLGRVIIRIGRDAAVRWWFGVDGDKRELAEMRQRSHGCCLRLQPWIPIPPSITSSSCRHLSRILSHFTCSTVPPINPICFTTSLHLRTIKVQLLLHFLPHLKGCFSKLNSQLKLPTAIPNHPDHHKLQSTI